MFKRYFGKNTFFPLLIILIFLMSACTSQNTVSNSTAPKEEVSKNNESTKETPVQKVKNNIALSQKRGFVNDKIDFSINELEPNKQHTLTWLTYDGEYVIEDLYSVIGPKFTEKEITLTDGTSDESGVWTGSFMVPDGFGGDFTVYVKSDNTIIGQKAFIVDPKFTMTPESGPIGSEITVKVEGLGWSTYSRNWQLTYDNKPTGLVTAISTNGTAEAKIRAAGPVGKHAIRLRTGHLGMQYINWKQSPLPDKPAPDFLFEVTDEKPLAKNFVEPIPVAADGGVKMPELKNKPNVKVTLDKNTGIVEDPVKLTASGLPANKNVDIIWNAMRGSRVSGGGFSDVNSVLATIKTDANGNVVHDFQIPDDLGGIPHRIDLKVDNEIVGQEYLQIQPSIVSMSPTSGPVGTVIEVTLKGGGWTEFDNAYYLTYDNAFSGYMCAFNSEGTLTFDVVASGEKGYHIIDLYPGIYRQKEKETDMTIIPQLTYQTDHPGSSMPAIRLGFEVTE